jgi:chromosome segregation ATPase
VGTVSDELTLARRQADGYAQELKTQRALSARLANRVNELEEALDEADDLESFGELSDQADATDAELERLRAGIRAIHQREDSYVCGGSCSYCRDADEDPVKWPCPTVALLDAPPAP